MKRKPPMDHPIVVIRDERDYWLGRAWELFDFLFIPFPATYWHYFLIFEVLLVCRFALASSWAKTTKVEANHWHEYKYDLFYVAFVIELFLFSSCFFNPQEANLAFLAAWLTAVFLTWGAFDPVVREYWRIRFYFVFYFFCFFGWFPSLLLWGGLGFGAYVLVRLFFFDSIVLFSLFFFFSRMGDFFMYRWLSRYWPLFNDTDSGEFFNLFDSYQATPSEFPKEIELFYSALFTKDNFDPLATTPHSQLVALPISQLPLHDTPGIGGGLIGELIPIRDKEDGEDLNWYLYHKKLYLDNFHYEVPGPWDRHPTYGRLANTAWAHTENRVLSYTPLPKKKKYDWVLPVAVPELLTVEHDWEQFVAHTRPPFSLQYHLRPSVNWLFSDLEPEEVGYLSERKKICLVHYLRQWSGPYGVYSLGDLALAENLLLPLWLGAVLRNTHEPLQFGLQVPPLNVDDIVGRFTSRAFRETQTSAPYYPASIQEVTAFFSFGLRRHPRLSSYRAPSHPPLQPWYYGYLLALGLRNRAPQKKKSRSRWGQKKGIKDWTPADTLDPAPLWNYPPHVARVQDIIYYLPHYNAPSYGLREFEVLTQPEYNWFRARQITDGDFGGFVELIDVGLKHQGLSYIGTVGPITEEPALMFGAVDQGSFALFYLHAGLGFAFEDFLGRTTRLDALGFVGFVLSYDLGVIRWRVLFFYLRSMWLIGRWGKVFFSPSYYFPNLSEFFLIWGNNTKHPPR